MNDLQFQLDMAQSVIQHLDSKEKMYQLVCSTSRNAFIYVDFSKKSLSVLGNWSSFFDFMISNESELIKIIEAVEDDYRNDLQKLLFFERTQMYVVSGVL